VFWDQALVQTADWFVFKNGKFHKTQICMCM